MEAGGIENRVGEGGRGGEKSGGPRWVKLKRNTSQIKLVSGAVMCVSSAVLCLHLVYCPCTAVLCACVRESV